MNQNSPTPAEESVSTEPQRRALEHMSAQLIHNLNLMIAEQEERVRVFAEQHHSQSPIPEAPAPQLIPELAPDPAPLPTPPVPQPTPQPEQKQKPIVAKFKSIARTTPPLTTAVPSVPQEEPLPPKSFPVLDTPRRASKETEEKSIGVGTIVTIIVVILFLLRACS